MTIEEAIRHAEDVVRRKCDARGDEHQQLADWLKELVALRSVLKAKDAEIAELRARLKVAVDALEYAKGSITRDCTNDCDHFQECGGIEGCLCERRINNALTAIAKEGVNRKELTMTSENETVKQLCEMGINDLDPEQTNGWVDLFNRIEAAHEREIAAKDAEIAKLYEGLERDDMTSDNPVDEVMSRASIVEKFQSKAQMVFYAVREALEKLITTETVLLCDIRPCRGFDYDGVLVREGNILLKYRSVHERYEFVADPYLFALSEPEQITDYWYQHKLKENKRLIEEAEKFKARVENDEEYATYLRLKEKYEGKETDNE